MSSDGTSGDYSPDLMASMSPITAALLAHWQQQYAISKREYQAGRWGMPPGAASISNGTLASRPAAPAVGTLYWATDTGLLYAYTGSAWTTIGAYNANLAAINQGLATTSSPTFASLTLGSLPGASISSGTLANRPASPIAGQIYYATDTGAVYAYLGGAWVTIVSGSGSMPTRLVTLVLSGAGGWPAVTSGCAGPNKTETSSYQHDIQTLDFAAGSNLYAQWEVELPSGYTGGTFTAQFVWSALSGSGNVIWGIQLVSIDDGEVIDQAWGTAQEVTDTLIAVGDRHRSAATGAITAAGTPAGGETLRVRVYRKSSDTFTGIARLHSVRLKCTCSYTD